MTAKRRKGGVSRLEEAIDAGRFIVTAELLTVNSGGLDAVQRHFAPYEEFVDAVRRVASGGTALDPEVVAQLFSRRGPLEGLSPREREVLGLMAEGRSNAAIADALVVTPRAVEKHVRSIFQKLRLMQADTDHRRVLAVLRYLEAR